jgi:hypothetical protein
MEWRRFFAGKVERYDPAPECKGVNAPRESREAEGGKWGLLWKRHGMGRGHHPLIPPTGRHPEVTAIAQTRLDSRERPANFKEVT